jgi:hypothetical protein
MKKILLNVALFTLMLNIASAQEKEKEDKEEKEKGFRKENLFTGGSISLAFYNNTFLVGGSPVLGYSITNWADAGIVANYNYTSYRDYQYVYNDKLRQSVYGGGAFARVYPVRFLFLQGQIEHNWIKQKYIPNIGVSESYTTDANSMLIGGGYTTGRFGKGGGPFFYVAIMFDVSGSENSPYTDAYGRTIPIVRGGLQVPLFQKTARRER